MSALVDGRVLDVLRRLSETVVSGVHITFPGSELHRVTVVARDGSARVETARSLGVAAIRACTRLGIAHALVVELSGLVVQEIAADLSETFPAPARTAGEEGGAT